MCVRCRLRGKPNTCVYRSAPFQRTQNQSQRRDFSHSCEPISSSQPLTKKPHRYTHPSGLSILNVTDEALLSRRGHVITPQSPLSPSASRHNHYPNPGYLGQSSHIAIFNHILSEQDSVREPLPQTPSASSSLEEHPSAKQGALLTWQLLSSFDLRALGSLVTFWRAKDVNLAGAGPFVDLCADTVNYTSLSTFQGSEWHFEFAARLLQNTTQHLDCNRESTISTYSAQFLGTCTRWETFGIFLSAAIQATRDVPFFPSLYTTSSQNRDLRRLLTRLVDCCVDICLSTDCLNDLQLILQYENFIIHSFVDGDQSRSDVPNNWDDPLTTRLSLLESTWRRHIFSLCSRIPREY